MPPKSKDAVAYKVLVGLSYPGDRPGKELRAEAGDVVTDLPDKALPWLVEQGLVEEV